MSYCGINAKIKAMSGNLCKEEDFKNLLNFKSVPDIGLHLKNSTAYKDSLVSLSDSDIHRGFLELKIIMALFDDFYKIHNYVSDFGLKGYLTAFFKKHELYVLKILMSAVSDNRDFDYSIQELKELFRAKDKFDIQSLLMSKNIMDFIKRLEGTEFYDVLKNVYTENTTVFQLSMQLDLYYYLQLKKSEARYLDIKNKKIAKNLIGADVDLQNILWIYRLKTYYKTPPNYIYSLIIPNEYKLKKGQINRMIEARSVEELQSEILQSQYGKAFTDFNNIDTCCRNEIVRIYKNNQVMYANSVAPIMAYLFFKEAEIKNIISIVEGIRYEKDTKEIMDILVFGKRGGSD